MWQVLNIAKNRTRNRVDRANNRQGYVQVFVEICKRKNVLLDGIVAAMNPITSERVMHGNDNRFVAVFISQFT
ncbi:hypothetical protein D3C80_883630 [compost metagenome]